MRRQKQTVLYLASAGIPCLLFLVTLMLIGAAPFGDKSILISDACGQYLDFLSYWKTVLSGENDLFYTFSKNMGGDMLNLAAYYLLSPFNLLFVFSTQENLPVFYTAVAALKIALCAATFFHTSGKLWGFRASHLLFSTAYALMAYNTLYGWNIMWLDGVIILPLLALGLHRMLEGGSPRLYIFSLFYGLATNFYIGYMLCITAVILLAALLFIRNRPMKETLHCFIRFCGASLIGGLSAAFMWLPTFLSIIGERSQTNFTAFGLSTNFSIFGFLPKLLCGSASVQEMAGGTPHVFCGTIVLLLTVLFLLNKNIRLRIRIAAAGVLAILFLSFWLQPLNIVWHGFSTNNSFNYRYAFIFSFFLILTAQYQFDHSGPISRKACLVSCVLILLAFLMGILQQRSFSHTAGTLASLAVLTCFLVFNFRTQKKYAAVLLCAVSFLELGLNCVISWNSLMEYPEMVHPSELSAYARSTGAAVDYVKESDTGFYRMEKTYHRTINDASFFSYNGLSHFSSTEPVFTKVFMRKMGFSSEYDFWAWYGEGSTAEVDSLLGVKYLLSQEDLSGKKDYTLLTQTSDGVFIYRNENALPVAMLCEPGIRDVSASVTNLVSLHNTIWQSLTGGSETILRRADYSVSAENLTAEQTGSYTVFEKTDPSRDAAIRFEISVSGEQPLYLFFSAPDYQSADLYINGEYSGIYFDMNRWNMVNTGTHTPGDTLVVELRPGEDSLAVAEPCFFYENPAALADMAASIQSSAPQLTRLSSSRFEGSFTADSDQLLLFTIPYNSGWQLTIDGEKAECITVLDAFLAAKVSPGSHRFTLRYIPRGLFTGCSLTVIALSASGIWYWIKKKRAAR